MTIAAVNPSMFAGAVATYHRVTIIDDARTDTQETNLITPASGNRLVFLGGFVASDGATAQFGQIESVDALARAVYLWIPTLNAGVQLFPVDGAPWGWLGVDDQLQLETRRTGTQQLNGVLLFAEVPA